MKLFAKYNRINLIVTIIIFLFASVSFYFLVNFILISQVDDDLRIEQHEIQTYIKEHGRLPEVISVKDQTISYSEITSSLKKDKFETGIVHDSLENETTSSRILVFGVEVNGKFYRVTVSKSLEGTDDLLHSILLVTIVTVLLILATAVVINRVLLRRLWQPFYDTLHVIKNFKLDRKEQLNIPASDIEEFKLMNQVLDTATRQARQDYSLLKEFTENASHEMQTPLAIIRSKLDLLIQDENLSENQSSKVQGAYQAIEKLSRLNQSLLLLAKIENNQYTDTSVVNLEQKISEKITAFQELWQSQEIKVSSSLENVTVKMNAELADILLNNLLSNATRHNFPEGFIDIKLTAEQLTIRNSSLQHELDHNRLFMRFYKQEQTKSRNGLGLSIIKQICDVSGFSVQYLFSDQQHSFIILLSP